MTFVLFGNRQSAKMILPPRENEHFSNTVVLAMFGGCLSSGKVKEALRYVWGRCLGRLWGVLGGSWEVLGAFLGNLLSSLPGRSGSWRAFVALPSPNSNRLLSLPKVLVQ